MLRVLTLLVGAICAGSVSAFYKKTVVHGNQLTLDLPERTHKLEFASADENEEYVVWQKYQLSTATSKGYVSSVSQGYKLTIRYVTFDDAGTYTLKNTFGATISSYAVMVVANRDTVDRIAGETLTIRLGGLKKSDASLHFYGNYSSVSLVESGVPVANSHPDYFNRIKLNSDSFQIVNVNVSDLGKYVLTDHKGRVASNITMILVDERPITSVSGFASLLLLLGLPCGVYFFCCRQRNCNSCRTTTTSHTDTIDPNSMPVSIPCTSMNDPGGPVGPGGPGQGYIAGYPSQPDQIHYPPQPGYNGQPVPPSPGYIAGYPPQPDQGQTHYPAPPAWNGQPAVPPNPGLYPGFVPQNQVYPPDSGPAAPPPQPPQWNAPPIQYNSSAPVNYTAGMSSAPTGPGTTGMNMNEMPPTAPLLTPQPEHHQSALAGVSMDVLSSSDTGVQFDINKGKSSGNSFL